MGVKPIVPAGECPHCAAGEPSVWDGVLEHYAHPAPNDKFKLCWQPWKPRRLEPKETT